MLTKIRVLLHNSSNIGQNPDIIKENLCFYAGYKLLPSNNNYREIEEFSSKFEINKANDILKFVSNLPLQNIADTITKYFNCPDVYVQFPKITSNGILITYCRGELERNMLFLKIVLEEPD